MITSTHLPCLKVSNLILNPRTKIVSRQGKNICLRRKEFELLKFLISNKGAVINKDELLMAVWGYKPYIITNTIEVHIKNLRGKVDHGFKKPLIRTVHGMGYKIEA